MADTGVVQSGENSPEQVAYKLMTLIADVENREVYGHGRTPVNREWVLRTYAQCLRLVRAPNLISDVLKEYAPEPAPQKR